MLNLPPKMKILSIQAKNIQKLKLNFPVVRYFTLISHKIVVLHQNTVQIRNKVRLVHPVFKDLECFGNLVVPSYPLSI